MKETVIIEYAYYLKLSVIIPEKDFFNEKGILYIDYDNENVIIEKDYLEKLEKKYRPIKQREERLFRVRDLNNEGMELEKQGKIAEAVEVYEECIKIPVQARHAYDRLLVLYNKAKEYKKELRVCKKAIKMFKGETKYEKRLLKIEAKLNACKK